MTVSIMRRSSTIVQRMMVGRTSRATASAIVTKRHAHSHPIDFYSSTPQYDVQHQLYSSSGWSGLEAADWDEHQFGYRVVSPMKQPTCSDTLSEDDFLVKDTAGATVAYDPCYIGSSFLPQQDDSYEQEDEVGGASSSTTCSPSKLSLVAEVLAAHGEWDAMLSTMSTSESSMHQHQHQRKLSLVAEVVAAHNEWDALLENECEKPPHFECMKEDPYLSDYEEMLPHHAKDLKLVTHCDDLDDDCYNWDFDFKDSRTVAR